MQAQITIAQTAKKPGASKLKDIRRRYNSTVVSLEQAESRMQPVLGAFQDQVLYLKHNLNARAVSALKGELQNIKTDIDRLIRDMQNSIDQSRRFAARLKR